MAPYPASQLMRESKPSYVILIANRAGIKQVISDLKQLGDKFQLFGVFKTSHIATNREPDVDQNKYGVKKNWWAKKIGFKFVGCLKFLINQYFCG